MRVDTSKKIDRFITADNLETDGDKGFKYIKDDNGNLWVYIDDEFENHSKNVALGMSYNEDLNSFIRPQPYKSWIFDEESGSWSSPIDYPSDDAIYSWNEEILNWEEVI
jgi:hypothetical protein